MDPAEVNNTKLYQNIFDTYSNSIESKNFDALLAGVKGNLSYVLCLCLNAAKGAEDRLNQQNQQSPELSSEIDETVQKIQNATAAAQLRYDYFAEKWTTLIGNYRKVPSPLFSVFLPYVKANLPDTSSKMSGMIFRECGYIISAVLGDISSISVEDSDSDSS